jgi:hypothetical protein
MADDAKKIPVAGHGSLRLPEVDVDSYNVELRDDEGFVGDRANREAFGQSLDKWREPLRKLGADPFGDKDTSELGKKELEAILTKGDPEAEVPFMQDVARWVVLTIGTGLDNARFTNRATTR